VTDGPPRTPTYHQVLSNGEFRALFTARVLSDWGDAIARVAISALVLHRSGSAMFAAAVFAVSFLPQVFGQALLAPYADRVSRRTLLVVCDLLRASFVAILVLAVVLHVPLLVLLVLLFVVELVGAPFFAAGYALLTELFDDRAMFLRASSLTSLTSQLNQVLGVALGGLVVGFLGATRAPWIDPAPLIVSAVILSMSVRPRAAAAALGLPGLGDLVHDVRDGLSHLRRDQSLRALLVLAWVMPLVLVAPEAVALPYAASHGEDAKVGGVLLAAVPFGAVVGVWLVGRWSPLAQVRRMLPLASLAPVPLLGLVADPSWPVAALLFVLSGLCQGFMVPLMATYSLLAPDAMRGRLNGLAGSGFALVTAIAFVAVGALADLTTEATAVVVAAVATGLFLGVTWAVWPRQQLIDSAARTYS
jgi:MFS family permease